MIPLQLSKVSEIAGGTLIGDDREVSAISTDTRKQQSDSLFVALKGVNFDAHNFVADAQQQGAVALLVSKAVDSALPRVEVENTLHGLGSLAHYNRQQCRAKIIGLTGSSGKTTVKEMLASVLSLSGSVLATHGNLNNEIGVPLTLLRLNDEYDYAVVEMGANHAGEIAYTSGLTQPDVALINNVAPAHLEGFGSIEGIAKAKAEIFSGLREGGIAIINLDSEFCQDWLETNKQRQCITYSVAGTADVFASAIEFGLDGCASFTLNVNNHATAVTLTLPGEHNVANALAVAAAATAIAIPLAMIAAGLSNVEAVSGRLHPIQLTENLLVIDDTYNANPGSVKAAIDYLVKLPGTSVLVLGDMGELGPDARELHREIGGYALNAGVAQLFTCGLLSTATADGFGASAKHFTDKQALIEALARIGDEQTAVLVKGSRSARMEDVVRAMTERCRADSNDSDSNQNDSAQAGTNNTDRGNA